MGFLCPDCGQPDLEIRSRLELPADARWDEIALQWVVCGSCPFVGLAVYRESRRGALDDEVWDHLGYRVPAPVVGRLQAGLLLCPDPDDGQCPCAIHRELAVKSSDGDWIGPEELWRAPSFPMVRRG